LTLKALAMMKKGTATAAPVLKTKVGFSDLMILRARIEFLKRFRKLRLVG
jgi:hypothetical protein